jgi:ATP-dependent phosphofructokinase / diphosphate-dependent phosphofructokinase
MAETFVIAQGGGPTAVINQTLAGAVVEAKRRDPKARVLGALHGVRGIRYGNYVDLSAVPEAELMRIAATPSAMHAMKMKKPDSPPRISRRANRMASATPLP